jgi:hypothetical protein
MAWLVEAGVASYLLCPQTWSGSIERTIVKANRDVFIDAPPDRPARGSIEKKVRRFTDDTLLSYGSPVN